MPNYPVQLEKVAAAKLVGWKVEDLNNNANGSRVRGPNWALYNPAGEIVDYGWTQANAWQKLPVEYQSEVQPQVDHLQSLSPNPAIAKIIAERNRQDAKWGEQNHDAGKWSLILQEELGEVAKAQLEGDRDNYLTELVQTAAVVVAWLECELRKDSK